MSTTTIQTCDSQKSNFSNQQSKTFNPPLDVTVNNKYPIVKFWLSKNDNKSGYITTDDGKEYWINKACYEILKDYFKMQNGKITCLYNSRLVYPKLTLITEGEVEFDIGISGYNGPNNKKIVQKLKLEIEGKSFTFYLNHAYKIDFSKEGLYKFSSILVIYNKIILGYEYSEDRYYNLSQFNDYILKNIDTHIVRRIKDTSALIKKELKSKTKKSGQNKSELNCIFTYLYKKDLDEDKLRGRLPLGLGIKIDNERNFQIINGKLDKTFERILDITKLSKNNKIIVNDDIIIDFD